LLLSTIAVGDVLIEAREWADPLLIYERDILLGLDEAGELAFAQNIGERQLTRGGGRLGSPKNWVGIILCCEEPRGGKVSRASNLARNRALLW